MKLTSSFAKVILFFLLFSIAITFSIYWHNNFIKVRTSEIPITDLPPEFEGFTIVHITDLHGSEFGNGQIRIKKALKNKKIDAIALTGDYIDKTKPDVEPVVDLLAALPQGVPKAFVLGNSDIWSPKDPTGQYQTLLESVLTKDCTDVSIKPAVVNRGKVKLVFSDTLYFDDQPEAIDIIQNANIKIALTHIQPSTLNIKKWETDYNKRKMEIFDPDDPNVIGEPETDWPDIFPVDFDLLLAGHTHAGQVRVPVIGALYAPGLGFFPKANKVYGLSYAYGRAQFVGAGLGATSTEGFMTGYAGRGESIVRWVRPYLERATSVRVFNPATIDILVLRAKKYP